LVYCFILYYVCFYLRVNKDEYTMCIGGGSSQKVGGPILPFPIPPQGRSQDFFLGGAPAGPSAEPPLRMKAGPAGLSDDVDERADRRRDKRAWNARASYMYTRGAPRRLPPPLTHAPPRRMLSAQRRRGRVTIRSTRLFSGLLRNGPK